MSRDGAKPAGGSVVTRVEDGLDAAPPPKAEPAIDANAMIRDAVASERRRQEHAIPPALPVPASATTPRSLSPALLIFGVVLPALTILIEAAVGLCRRDLFDPIPTLWHTALVSAVPAGNLIVLLHLSGAHVLRARWLPVVMGFVAGIAGFYALLFLPLTPFALVAILVGVGILPLAPLTAFLSALRLIRHVRHMPGAAPRFALPFASGLAAALLAVVAADIPLAITRIGIADARSPDAATRARGIALLRTWGSTEILLEHCYGRTQRPAGPLSIPLAMHDTGLLSRPRPLVGTAEAREIYYRVTGRPFNTDPRAIAWAAPFAGRVTFDRDLGGTAVGGLVPGLSLVTSRLDGSIAADDAVAYVEWLFEVRNDGAAMSEARMSIALPPGAVVSRVTLWVNGVEEEAAFAGRSQVRAAYERVVRRSQDPFLVTTNGADRILAQAFPVLPNGGVMKFRIGITAPLELESDRAKGRLVLPAIVDRNFAVGDTLRHAVWLESKRPLTASRDSLVVTPGDGSIGRLTGEIGDQELSRARAVVTVTRDPAHRLARAVNPETGSAEQEISPAAAHPSGTLMLVVDASATTRPHVKPILAALRTLPAGQRVGVAIAGDRVTTIAPAPWSPALEARVTAALDGEAFVGGVDNTDALAAAMLAVAGDSKARLVWIHGPQPVRFASTRARFDQVRERLRHPPSLSLYALAPGPNSMLADAPWSGEARDIPATGDITADLARAFRHMTGAEPVPVVRRTLRDGPILATEPHMPQIAPPVAAGSSHLVRLAAHDEIRRLIRDGSPEAVKSAIELASLHRLVTPISGAVVLETKKQYADAGLVQGMKGEKGAVPTVPEPQEWALLLLAALGLGWVLRRRGPIALGQAAGAR